MNRKLALILAVILIVIVLFLAPFYTFIKNDLKVSPLKTIFSLDGIKKVDNQTNILILGIPGGSHEGPLLSDSITIVHYDFTKKQLISIGIPRDIWSDTLQDKINSAYAYGEGKKEGGGLKLAKAEIGSIVGFPIEYGAVINFQEFKKLIDFIGGVDVDVQRSFVDKKFPIDGKEDDPCGGDPEFKCRYQTVSFTKDRTHMDGETALKFVRSRNAEGDEGSDFARSQRQQLVLSAIKDKVKKTLLSFNLPKIKQLYDSLDKLVIRDISNQQVAILFKDIGLGKNFSQKSFALPKELFTIPNPYVYYGKYVLIPIHNDFGIVHKYVACLFSTSDEKKCL